jgi:diguanylate cyclase (GGDEF)-like protein/PAS domain S-box-containing protein
MTLRQKSLGIISVTMLVLIALLYTFFQPFVVRSLNQLEEKNTIRNVERALEALSGKISRLDMMVTDWSHWDDTYAFILDGNNEYVKANLVESTFLGLDLNLLLMLDTSGQIVYGRGFDLDKAEHKPLPEGIVQHVQPDSILLDHEDEDGYLHGLILLPEAPLLIASRPILTSNCEGPIRGTLIMGRYLDSGVVAELARRVQLGITAYRLDETGTPADLQEALAHISEERPVFRRVLDSEYMAGYVTLEDIYGEPALLWRVDVPREIYQQSVVGNRVFIMSLVISGVVVGLLILFLLDRVILSRLSRLNESINNIGQSGDTGERVEIQGHDELSHLAGSVNVMLERLEHSQGQLRESEQRYRTIFETTRMATAIIEEDTTISLANSQFERYSGYSKPEIEGLKSWREFVHPDDMAVMERYHRIRRVNPSKAPRTYEFRFVNRDGSVRDTLLTIAMIPGTTKSVASLFDITERKQAEARLRYISLHDTLTGLYNRAYFEQELQRLADGRQTPVGMILCDLDALKFVNDSLGHDTGDALLKATAVVIQSCFRASDMVARIGGDEFAVLLPKSDETALEESYRRIKQAIESHNDSHPELPISMSVGYAVTRETVSLKDLFKEADNNMYREKLHNSEKTRSATISILTNALEARDYLSQGHADRLQDLVVALGRASGVSETRIEELKLLARFHDIGKVGIPDQILFKPGLLSPEERMVMNRHSEIGYRIAQSVPDLILIADWILKHHEWYDGRGYPLGLKGEEIPLECRLFAIADAYEAMTNDHPYRPSRTHQQAVEELLRGAGTQFDPQLVQRFLELHSMPD